LILGARKDEDVIGVSGRTVWYTSTELEHWTFEGGHRTCTRCTRCPTCFGWVIAGIC
jgi:hypothetical protein